MILPMIIIMLSQHGLCLFVLQCQIFGKPRLEDLYRGPYIVLIKDVQWCDAVLGCLDVSRRWLSASRRLNCIPYPREKINTLFYLNTRQLANVNKKYLISADDLSSLSQFDASKPTKVIVHGLLDGGNTSWLKEMASKLLAYDDYNVIRVDWGKGSRATRLQATANTRVAGMEIGRLLNILITEKGLNPANVHCIGHSLGAQTCGYAGERVQNMGRISGIDPTIEFFANTPTFVRLDPTDAIFVDVIGTEDRGRGIQRDYGNVNFYPNLIGHQPGCDIVSILWNLAILGDLEDDLRDAYDCSHVRAIKLFSETITRNPSCTWIGQECDSYDSFDNGKCFSCGNDESKCAYFGIRADEYVQKSREKVTMYLKTNSEEPFCAHQYQVSIVTAKEWLAKDTVIGRLYITVYGDNEQVIRKHLISKFYEKINHGTVKTFLFISRTDINKATRIDLTWLYSSSFFDPSTWCQNFCKRSLFVKSVQIIPLNRYPESARVALKVLLCGENGSTTKIRNGQTETFEADTGCQAP